jgi:hypothetical protein
VSSSQKKWHDSSRNSPNPSCWRPGSGEEAEEAFEGVP